MTFNELVDRISAQTKIGPGQVSKVLLATSANLEELINAQEDLTFPRLLVKSVVVPQQEATYDRPFRPEAKFARITLRKGV